METFTEPKGLVANPHYQGQKQKCLEDLNDGMLDKPIIELINAINKRAHCFTLQCCYGHFIYKGQNDLHNLAPLPVTDTIARVAYRIAYLAFCIENSPAGRGLLSALEKVTRIDRDNIQFGCAEWFWHKQINSYVLQVEPDRFKCRDRAIIDYEEALHIERIRNAFFRRLLETI